jgi:hypothetical protein
MERFALLLTEDDDAWSQLPQAKQDELVARYGAWSDAMRKQGQLAGTIAFGGRGAVLEAKDGKILQRPDDSPKGVATALFLIDAKNLADAVQIARGCPGLDHGERVTIRPL